MAGTVRVDQYVYTENVYFDEHGQELGRKRNYDDYWNDTVEERKMDEIEEADWLNE